MAKRRPIMIMGCTSDAGKSFLVTALCRHASNRGLRVAPFKGQNMSNNAAVTSDGGEIGRAQWLQARAARVEPDVRMNPVLLKPTSETWSQVIVLGRVDDVAGGRPWLERRELLWPAVRGALHALLDEHELVVIEGAGSPAEINLRPTECVNFAVAKECRADVYIVVDIDRGGAFAHLLGTWMALEPDERALVKGFVLNRFRGDPELLLDAPRWLEERTGVPIVAIVPLVRHVLPEEDAFVDHAAPGPGEVRLALVLYPYASNLDEWDPLRYEPGVSVVPIRARRRLDGFDAILLPGSKNTAASLAYLVTSGLAEELRAAAAAGARVLGVCGGAQILGRSIHDPEGVESDARKTEALGLLDIETTFRRQKTVRRTKLVIGGLGGLDGAATLDTYEIHHGEVVSGPRARATLAGGLGWGEGTVEGVMVHDLPRSTVWRQRFLEGLGWRGRAIDYDRRLDDELDRVAHLVEASGLAKAVGL